MSDDLTGFTPPDWLQAIQHEPDNAMWSLCEHCEETPQDFHVPCPVRVRALIESAEDRDRVRDQLSSFVAQVATAHGLPATSAPEIVPRQARVIFDAAHRACRERDDAQDEARRLRDLARYARQELHEAGLLDDVEYAALAADGDAVARIQGYDKLRVEVAALRERLAVTLSILSEVMVHAAAWVPAEPWALIMAAAARARQNSESSERPHEAEGPQADEGAPSDAP